MAVKRRADGNYTDAEVNELCAAIERKQADYQKAIADQGCIAPPDSVPKISSYLIDDPEVHAANALSE